MKWQREDVDENGPGGCEHKESGTREEEDAGATA